MADAMRFITADDPLFPAVVELRTRVLYEPLGLPGDQDFRDRDPSARHLIALADGTVVGYARLNMVPGGAQIRHLAVASSERGKGTGAALVDELIERACKEGCTTVWVNARFTALGFWRRTGFTDTVDGMTLGEDTYVPHKRMERRVP